MRRPLAFLIVLEIAVVAALAAATYHVVTTRGQRPPPIAAAPAPAASGASRPAAPRRLPPRAPVPTPTPRGPAPGLSLDAGFWNDQLERVNRDQAQLADIQSRAARAVTDWVRAYVDGVLLPAVREAEKK